ncbi:hypothetical protein KY285_012417 [Solanum tuberosum]|nr:hypothetical protein KY285_012417 [Solanum tuberosum]
MSWNESGDCCSWDGVTCDLLNGHVIGLDLSCSRLFGTFHPNSSLFQLHHLQTLNLANNYFDSSSSIPHNIGQLTNLRHLNLSWSHFSGKIPTEISYLSNLVSLDLYNGYELQLDERTFETMLHNFTNLEVLSLYGVNISSPIPVNISSSSLRYLDLQFTNMRGVLTESFFLLLNSLETLKLSGNDLLKGVFPKIHPSNTLLELDISYTGISGELPDSIGTFSSLNILSLGGCRFSGSIPDSIGNLTQITELDLSFNHFTGHIPSTISKLKHLTHLYLFDNSLGGTIPQVFSNLQELVFLDLSYNNFTGPFPSSIFRLTSLRYLYLSHNSLNGTIHSWVFSLPSLRYLYLDHNQFSRVADEIQTNPTLETLYLNHNQLNGPFPQSLVNLTNLAFLDFSSNNITSDVGINITFPSLSSLFLSSCELKDFPHFLRNIKNLSRLDLSNNKIRGQIPNWFRGIRWDSLEQLNLSRNFLTGHLEQFQCYSLKSLDLKFNFLQGSLPSSICNLRSLRILDLSRNNFSNSIPNCLGSMAKLTVLDLRRNNFSGSLPLLCTQSTSLTTIVLNSNQLEGSLPVSLLNCVGLKVLDLGNNAINDAFPAWLGTLEDLQVLILKSNKFHGPISARKKFCFPRLRIFDLSHNAFNGTLPAEVFRNFKAMIKNGTNKGDITYMKTPIFIRHKVVRQTELEIISNEVYEDSVRLVIKGNDMDLERISTIDTAIDLSSNHFEGDIPKSLKDLSSLRLLNLSHNNLKGDIPMELGQLNTLEALDLSWNRLTGKIPQELTTMNFLAFLNLSQNHLIGLIPQGSQFSTFENDSYGGNLDLCGAPLSKQCGTSDSSHVPQPLDEEEEHELYFFRGFTWESVVIGYSFGLVVGTIMWSLMFNYRQASFPKTKSWNESRDCCTWDGVTCDMLNGHVIGLELSCSRLKGTIHPNSSLFQLHHLQTLNLAYNNFSTSSIPHNIGRLTNLRDLNLSYSYFDGKIPTEISYLSNLVSLDLTPPNKYELQLDQRTFEAMLHNLTNLEVLSLSFVNISSPIPVNISSSLRYVDLEYTNLRGVLTENFFILPNLERLKLGFNALLKGVLPKIHPSNTLLELDISYTGISGEIPDVFSNLQELRYLDLYSNSFIGSFPSTILNLIHLQYLDLSSNSLSGSLPSNASMFPKLIELDLSYNSLNGTIPSWVFSLPLLTSLSLQNNQFSVLADELKKKPTLEDLYLSNNQLNGSFLQSLANLTNLFTLDISSNNITGDAGINITFPSLEKVFLSSCELRDFPHFLRNVKTLQVLDISNNKIRGQIPNWFSSMRWNSLQFLNLSHNSLTGHLQQFHYYSLKYLDLKFNFLQGSLPLTICNISSLSLLDLSHNNFSGSVPHCFGSMVELSVLDFRRNNFTGSLPPFCAQTDSLKTIVLNGNLLKGPVPVSLLNCVGLEVLDLGNNAINDIFPAWLGTLQELQVLILKFNLFHGPISTCQTEFCFPKLRIFDLSRNEFSGSLPAKVFGNFKAMIKLDGEDTGEIKYMEPYENFSYTSYENSVRLVIKGHDTELERISTIMTTIDLSSNHFEGVIPKSLKDLSSLWLLNLSYNNLKGDIPMELGQLNMLEALDLSWNRLTGKIPQGLTRMNFLAVLNLSQNHLVGPIPHSPQFNTFENGSYGRNLDLCGPPLSKQCGTSDSSHVPQPLKSEEYEDKSYFFSGFTWESVIIGYSFGLVAGTVVWSLIFKYRKPKWFVEFFEGIFPKKMRRSKKIGPRQRT